MTFMFLLFKSRVIPVLSSCLKHLNAGTLSVVMMIILGVVSATQGPQPRAGAAQVSNVVAAEMPTNVAGIGLDGTGRSSAVDSADRRTAEAPCSGFSRPSACLP